MDSQNIKRPWDYQKYYHTFTEGLICLDGRGNPIPLSNKLGIHIEAFDPIDVWNSIQKRDKVHTVPTHSNVPSNSTSIEPHTPP